jgi:hypothetical protein
VIPFWLAAWATGERCVPYNYSLAQA